MLCIRQLKSLDPHQEVITFIAHDDAKRLFLREYFLLRHFCCAARASEPGARLYQGKNWLYQWLVPAERVILLYTLYLPEGLLMGMRLISLNVAAS